MKPLVPTAELVELCCEDGSDYCDGDVPGWTSGTWDEEAGELVLTYEADEPTPYASTVRRFREVVDR